MPILIVAVILFVALIVWLITSDLMEQKDKIITKHLQTVRAMEKENQERHDVEIRHKLWLKDVAQLTKATEIRRLLLNYADPTPKKTVDPKAKTKDNNRKTKA